MKIKMPVVLLSFFVLGSVFLFGVMSAVYGNSANHLVISEVQISGGAGLTSNDFIELYNPTTLPIDLNGHRLVKRTAAGTSDTTIKSWTSSAIVPAYGYYLWANSNYTSIPVVPDATTTQTIADNNGVALRQGSENAGIIIDAVAWGSATNIFVEGFVFSQNPEANQSLERKASSFSTTTTLAFGGQEEKSGNGWDTDNNSEDFVLQSNPNPQNSLSAIENEPPLSAPLEEPEEEDEEPEEEEEPDEEEDETATSTPQYPNLKINEFLPNPSTTTEKEWVEIFNPTTSTIDLTGWTLSDGVASTTRVIASPTSTLEENSFVFVELSNLNDSGDIIVLRNPAGEIIDQVCYGNWIEGCAGEAVGKPARGNSIARITDGLDTNNDKNDFIETLTLTPGAANIITAPDNNPPTDSGQGGGSSAPAPVVSYNPGAIVINELVSDPADGQEEFVELFNRTGQNISLTGWWLEEGSESKTGLSGSIAPGGFFVIEKPKGNLNNAGDIVILFSPAGQEIDSVTYGNWDDGNLSDNAPRTDDPFSLARKVDGQDSDNDYYDFAVTATITKSKDNIITSIGQDGEKIEQVLTASKIVINEIYPNPPGPDTEDEFIELHNIGLETVDLKDWLLSDATTRKYKISGGIIQPGGFLVFKRQQTGIALNNTGGDEVKLYLPDGSLVANIKYTDKALEGQTYARQDDGSFVWTIQPTPEAKNIIEGKSAEPIVNIEAETEVAAGEEVLFDASDTVSPGGKEMGFAWDFGDKTKGEGIAVKHAFAKAGVYTVKLTVTDSDKNKAEKKIIITVKNPRDFVGGYLESEVLRFVKISEFAPNPEGSDSAEFIELFNSGLEAVDLSGLKLDDEEGGSRAYIIPDSALIEPGQYLVFGKQETKLALNNTADTVRLLFPDNTVITEVSYESPPEGAAYAQDEDDNWVWTSVLTPGEPNIITPATGLALKVSHKAKNEKPIFYAALDTVRRFDVGDKVELTGLAAVAPGILSSQYFYLVSEVGAPLGGVQVYMNKKDWPIMRSGDKLNIVGEISQAYGETRVKLSGRDSIKLLGQTEPPVGTLIKIEDLGENLEGALLKAAGEITELKTSYMYVDDGTEEVRVYFKSGANINKKIHQLGDLVEVTGLLGRTTSRYQLLPRGDDDIVKTGVAEPFIVRQNNLGAGAEKGLAETYLTVTAGGLTSILIGLGARARGRLALAVLKKAGKLALGLFWRGPKV